MKKLPFLALSATLALSACERPASTVDTATPPLVAETAPTPRTKTFETSRVGSAIDLYDREPTPVNHAAVKKAFSELDVEIAELQERTVKTTGTDRDEAAAKLANLQRYRSEETVRFAKAEAAHAVGVTPTVDDRSGAQKVEDGAKRVGESIEDAAKKTGEAIKDAVH